MKSSFDELLSAACLEDLRAGMADHESALSLVQVNRLREKANQLKPPAESLRLGIIHSYTSDLLDPWLQLAAAAQGVSVETYHAPYGLNLQEAQPDSSLVQHQPDVTLFLLQREDLHPALAEPLAKLDCDEQEALLTSVVTRLRNILVQFRSQPVGHMVVTLLPSVFPPGQGYYDAQSDRSESSWWARLKSAVASLIRSSVSSAFFLDLDMLLQRFGQRGFFDLRLWFSVRYPFSPVAAQALAQRIVDIGITLQSPKAKVIVLDADNTLWGGIVGEDGLHGIALGPEYPGNTFLEFQRRLLNFQQRGFVLAMCSKNNPDDVNQVLTEHPHQLLKDEHFAAKRVNWTPKPENLIAIAEELNLGLESFVFVDDSDYECAAVRHRLPQVEVVQTPAKPLQIPFCLDHVARLEVLAVTDEDRAKTLLYAQERNRKELQESLSQDGGGLTAYLESLEMVMSLGVDDAAHLKRLAQLTQKTNQFNLTTRRYDEDQMQGFIDSSDWWVMYFSLADVFGDSGIVGLALWRRSGSNQAVLDNFLMSCRVIGREAESAFLNGQLAFLTDQGITEVIAEYLPSPKNALVKEFLPRHGFELDKDGRYFRNLRGQPASPGTDLPVKIQWRS